MSKDRIFMDEPPSWGGFQFDEQVTRVFDDMLNRSIPRYAELQSMILNLVDHYYQEKTTIFDLGCSLGTLLGKIEMGFGDRVARLVGVDISVPMIQKAKSILDENMPGNRIELLVKDIKDVELEDASVVIMNFTLQFIRPIYREKLIRRIFQQLKPGGIFILSEKVIEENMETSKIFQDIYYRFKLQNGYSSTEIARKRECLEHVLVPYSLEEHTQLLKEAGFSPVCLFHKWFNFASFAALKPF